MNKLLTILKVVLIAALTVVILDKAAGQILYYLDPAFRRYVNAKSSLEKASAGENVNVLKTSLNGDIKVERIMNQ